jgi:hypothetical protein
MSDHIERKSAVGIAEMARMVGLSRGRFYQLVGTAFPWPLYDIKTRRPYYTEELQQVCLDVRRRNCGIDGRPVLFYARRATTSVPQPRRKKHEAVAKVNDHTDLIEGLKSLGLATVTTAQVEAALKSLYPSGANGTDQGEVLRAIFLHLRAQGLGR